MSVTIMCFIFCLWLHLLKSPQRFLGSCWFCNSEISSCSNESSTTWYSQGTFKFTIHHSLDRPIKCFHKKKLKKKDKMRKKRNWPDELCDQLVQNWDSCLRAIRKCSSFEIEMSLYPQLNVINEVYEWYIRKLGCTGHHLQQSPHGWHGRMVWVVI